MTNAPLSFHVLGPLEARLHGEELALGGGKQRAVLAALLLRAGEVVPVERLVDEVWGEEPPPSASHTLESYVSRLRQLLNGHGPRLVRRGPGYALELEGAALDARDFQELHERASLAASMEDHAQVLELTEAALALWRGPALADVALASSGRAEADRLEERRLAVYELRFDSELQLGRHEQASGELQALVAHNPYRERFVSQLMLALYRSGRQADALEAYERLRRRLDEDLGLLPSAELQQLSGQIVRQDPELRRRPVQAHADHGLGRRGSAPARKIGALVLAAATIATVTAFTPSGSASQRPSAQEAAKRVALVLPRSPETAIEEPSIQETAQAFRNATAARDFEGDVLVVDEEGASGETEDAMRRVEQGMYGLVLVAGEAPSRALAPLARRSRATQFAFLDVPLASLSLAGVPNATGMPFADHETSYLMGYLSGVVPLSGVRPGRRADVVSIVVSKATPRAERLVEAFRRGAARSPARPEVRAVTVADETDKSACENLAIDLIDAGTDVVYSAAGECSVAVLAVVKLRGAWGIRANDDPFAYGPHILATTYKRWTRAVDSAIKGFTLETLPHGRDVVLGLADDYAVDAWSSGLQESEAVWGKVARLCTIIRAQTKDDAP